MFKLCLSYVLSYSTLVDQRAISGRGFILVLSPFVRLGPVSAHADGKTPSGGTGSFRRGRGFGARDRADTWRHIVMAHIVMAYKVLAHMVMDYIVMAYIVMFYIVMAL